MTDRNAITSTPATGSDVVLREALDKTFDALVALQEAVKHSGKMNGREYIDLGIQVNSTLDKAKAALSASGSPGDVGREDGDASQVLEQISEMTAYTMPHVSALAKRTALAIKLATSDPTAPQGQDAGYQTRASDSSQYDLICDACGATDYGDAAALKLPCPATAPQGQEAEIEQADCTLCAAVESNGFYTGCMARDGHGNGWTCDGRGHLARLRTRAPDATEAVAMGQPHVEYSAARGQSKVTYWVSREDGERIKSNVPAIPSPYRAALQNIARMEGQPPFQAREVLMRKIAREALKIATAAKPVSVETIARIVEPALFQAFDGEAKKVRRAENGVLWADVVYGPACDAAREKARAIHALIYGGDK